MQSAQLLYCTKPLHGIRSASVSITDNASGSPQNVTLSGMGTAPIVSFGGATSLNFGNQLVGSTSTAQTVTLTNAGTATLTISGPGIGIGGSNSGDFAETDTCGSSVAAGANCTNCVTFKPTATGARNALISVTDNASGSPQSISLTGSGVAPTVTFSATSLTLAGQLITTTSSAQSITLTNSGTAPLTISSIGNTSNVMLVPQPRFRGIPGMLNNYALLLLPILVFAFWATKAMLARLRCERQVVRFLAT